MTQNQTITKIRLSARQIFATSGYDGLSMRILSKESGVGLSSIYHFFADKDVLLRDVYDQTNVNLGASRRLLPQRRTAEQMLKDRIEFQFQHIEEIVFVIRYYLQFRSLFRALPEKNLPAKAYLHIEEVLHKGISTGEFEVPNALLESQAKIITHSINGFLLEYYPDVPKGAERKIIIENLTAFATRSLKHQPSAA